MSYRVTPFCDVIKLARSTTGVVQDLGHCFVEEVTAQFENDQYAFSNFILEPYTNSLITKPVLSLKSDNNMTTWTGTGSYWAAVKVEGHPADRQLVKWTNSDPSVTYGLTSQFTYVGNEARVIEFGLLPSANTTTEPYVTIKLSTTVRLMLKKRQGIILQQYNGVAWADVCGVPIRLKHAWQDIDTNFIWCIPYWGGALFSSDGEDFVWIHPVGGLTFGTSAITIGGCGGIGVFGMHRVTYAAAQVTSAEIQTGSTPTDTDPDFKVIGWFDTDTVGTHSFDKIDLSSSSSSSYAYDLVLTPTTEMMGIQKVSVNHAPQVTIPHLEQTPTYIGNVIEVMEQIPENAYDETCNITLDGNTQPFTRFDEAQWYFGWQMNDGTTVPATMTPRNTGIITDVKVKWEEGLRKSTELICKPTIWKVKENTVVYAPDYQGWTVRDFLQDFLLRAGIPLAMQDLATVAEWAPMGWTLPDTGDKNPWHPQLGDPFWKMIEDVVYATCGGWIYSGRDGKIVVGPYTDPDDSGLSWGSAFTIYTDQMSNLEFHQPEEAIADLRNVVVVQGLSPDGYPLGAARRDEGSISNPSAANYCGMVRPLVIRHAGYTDQTFIDATLDAVYARVTKLRNGATFTTLPQNGAPDLYTGALIAVCTVDTNYGMVVRSVSSRIVHGEFVQTVSGHLVQM